jgi:hypothetical protein
LAVIPQKKILSNIVHTAVMAKGSVPGRPLFSTTTRRAMVRGRRSAGHGHFYDIAPGLFCFCCGRFECLPARTNNPVFLHGQKWYASSSVMA